MKRKWVLFIAAFIFIGLVYFLNNPSCPEVVKAGSSDNVSGWAWSENIGWISFNSTNTGVAVDYGVHIDPSTGLFSGYAWAGGGEMNGNPTATIGWISFNSSDLAGCPSSPCEARLDLTAGGTHCGKQYDVCGWARALAATSSPGGWDGWIRLRGTSTDGTPYGVSLNPTTRELEGWAAGWDDSTSTAVIGWISFNCLNESWCATSSYSVKTALNLNRPPKAVNLQAKSLDFCIGCYYTFSWDFSDPDAGDNQSAYQVQIDNNSDFSSPEIDSGKVNSSSNSFAPVSPLSWNTTYYWRVKVWDSSNLDSGWINGSSFTTPFVYPSPNFTITPSKPSVDVVVTFNNSSLCADECISYFWDFGNGKTSATSGNPTTTYSSSGYKTVSLRVTDNNGHTCTTTKTFYVGSRLPWWKEIIPF